MGFKRVDFANAFSFSIQIPIKRYKVKRISPRGKGSPRRGKLQAEGILKRVRDTEAEDAGDRRDSARREGAGDVRWPPAATARSWGAREGVRRDVRCQFGDKAFVPGGPVPRPSPLPRDRPTDTRVLTSLRTNQKAVPPDT